MSTYDTTAEERSDESTANDQRRLGAYERASGCSHGVENCPGPDSEIEIEDGKAVISGDIPCVGCYMESLNDCEYGELE